MLTNAMCFAIIVVVSELTPRYGEMSEWLKEPVLKTGNVRAFAGSNPALSSIYNLIIVLHTEQLLLEGGNCEKCMRFL